MLYYHITKAEADARVSRFESLFTEEALKEIGLRSYEKNKLWCGLFSLLDYLCPTAGSPGRPGPGQLTKEMRRVLWNWKKELSIYSHRFGWRKKVGELTILDIGWVVNRAIEWSGTVN